MKITFILPLADLAGGIRVVAIYAERLKKRGHEVFVISAPRGQPSLSQQVRSLLKGQGWSSVAKNEASHFDRVDVQHRVIDRYRPVTDADVPDADVVIATWWETAAWVAGLSPSKGAKAYFMQDYGAPGQELEKIIPSWSLPLHIITISRWISDLIREHCREIPVTVIPNAVDLNLFYAPSRGKQQCPTVGLNYRAMSTKGIDIALHAVQIASRTVPNLRLLAYGPERPNPLLPLPPNTVYEYKPTDKQIRKIYANCDAWLFASRIEGFGLPILEAMACRTPVIGTPAGAATELLADGAGMLVKPEDPKDMARAIAHICKLSDAEWQVMSDAAYAKATSYTWDDATELFEAELYTAIERRQRGDFSQLNPGSSIQIHI